MGGMTELTTEQKLEQAIAAGADSPEMVQNQRTGTVKERSLTQLQDVLDRRSAKDAAKTKSRGLRFTRLAGPPAS